MNSHCSLFKYTLAANGGKETVYATGNKIFVRTALQPVKIKFDTGAEIELEDGFRWTSEKNFTRLELTNNNAFALYVEFYVGDGTVQRDAPLYTRDARSSISSVSGPYPIDTTGLPAFAASAVGKHRKQIVICNKNATTSIFITNAAIFDGTKDIAEVLPRTSFTLFTSDTLWLRTNAGVATALITETLYAD